MKTKKTTIIKDNEVKREWHQLDASEMPLGRLASRAAVLLIGKHKVSYSPHQDQGDYVVVVNADKIKLSTPTKKVKSKKYYHYSGYPGGMREETLEQKLAKNPAEVIELAVKRMLAENRLRKHRMRRLKVVTGTEHNFPVKKTS